MFGTILIIAYTLMLAYVLWRASTVPWLARLGRPRHLLFGGAALWGLMVLGRVHGHDGAGPLAWLTELVGMSCLGSLFLIFLALVAADIATAFGFLLPLKAPILRGYALVSGVALAALALAQGHRAPEVVRHEIVLRDLPAHLDGTLVVALSDMHIGQTLGQGWLKDRIAQVQALRPEMIALVGDIHEGHGLPEGDLAAVWRSLSAPWGVWYVAGNHDHGDGIDILDRAGFGRLKDAWAEVRPGLILAGVDDLTSRRRRDQDLAQPVGRALSGRPPGATIFLSHTPWQAETAAAAGADLMISGHTHGGQLWPFGLLSRLVYPLQAGLYHVDGMNVLVSRGAGSWGPRMRLWHRGDILAITLRARGDTKEPPYRHGGGVWERSQR